MFEKTRICDFIYFIKNFFFSSIIILIIGIVSHTVAEKFLISKIKDDIESVLGNDYAIIALHVAGEDSHRPNLFRMLKKALIYEININGYYSPTGSGGFTGKNHHLAILMTNNSEIIFGEWSFRNWSLILDDTFNSWDLIENLSDSDQKLHSFAATDINNRGGLNYKDEVLNDAEISFYYRTMKPGIPE
jgi:uncharacterized SAM-binding protein YcdF (DUF218 family)